MCIPKLYHVIFSNSKYAIQQQIYAYFPFKKWWLIPPSPEMFIFFQFLLYVTPFFIPKLTTTIIFIVATQKALFSGMD